MGDPVPISESDTRRQVTELSVLGPRRGVAQLIGECRAVGDLGDNQRTETVVRALCAQNSVWIGEFRDRAQARKKCPPWLRPLLTDWLDTLDQTQTRYARLAPPDVLRRRREPKSRGTLTIEDQYELALRPESAQLIAKLYDLGRKPLPIDLDVDFRCEHVYVHGLALLAAWCDLRAANVKLYSGSPRVERYLQQTGFVQVVQDCVTIDAPRYDGEHHVALTRLRPGEQNAPNEAPRRLAELFHKHLSLDEARRQALQTMFAELIENVYRHARLSCPAYVMAQAYPADGWLNVVVADAGVGIHRTFRDSDCREIKVKASSDARAIELALQPYVTSKTSRHRGYGLYVVKRLVERNKGRLGLTSGRSTVWIGAKNQWRWRGSPQQKVTPNLPWHGTSVSLMFDLNRPLPLLDVYRELGPLDRQEDFFD